MAAESASPASAAAETASAAPAALATSSAFVRPEAPPPDACVLLEAWLANLSDRLDLDLERRRLVIDEVRSHLLDAADAHARQGLAPCECLSRALAALGPADRLAAGLNAAHAGSATLEALRFVVLPVLLALVLRWGVLTLDGRRVDWPSLALTAPFALFAAVGLIGPAVAIRRDRYTVACWAAFWVLTVLLLVGA